MPNHKHLTLSLIQFWSANLHWWGWESQITKENKANRSSHGNYIKSKINEVREYWQDKWHDIPLLLKIDPKKYDIDFLRSAFDFEIVLQEEDWYIIAVTSNEWLSILEDKIERFLEWSRWWNNVALLHEIQSEDDRLKTIMWEELYRVYETISDSDIITIDVSISCEWKSKQPSRRKSDTDETYKVRRNAWISEVEALMLQREDELEIFIEAYSGRQVSNTSKIEEFWNFTMRIEISWRWFRDLVKNFKYTFQMELPEDIGFATNTSQAILGIEPELTFEPPNEDSAIIWVIDSGIQEEHPYISSAIRSSLSKSYLAAPSVSDEVPWSWHWTRVAWAILFGNNVPKTWSYKLPYWLANIRVLDASNTMPKSIFPPYLMESIINQYKDLVKIFNHCINSSVASRRKYMSAWASKIDDLSYDNDILIVQSVWNIWTNIIKWFLQDGEEYPEFLHSNIKCRVANPGQSLQSITVGSLCIDDFNDGTLWSVWDKDHISPFSRVWLGIWDSTKPDLVEYGWGYLTDSTWNITQKDELCPELIRKSPWPLYSKDSYWTSYSTPKVTNIIWSIQNSFPENSCLLYRALITNSATWPEWANQLVNSDRTKAATVLSRIWYWLPDSEKSIYSSDYRTTFFTNSDVSIGPWVAHFYKIDVPDILLESPYDIKVEVTLSYKAKPRRTRLGKSGYLSTSVDWDSSKLWENITSFKGRIFNDDESSWISVPWAPMNWILWRSGTSSSRIWRSRSTLQKDWCIIKSDQLDQGFYLWVVWHNWWDDTNSFPAKYSLVVSFEAVNRDIAIYNELKLVNEAQIELPEAQIEEQIEIQSEWWL